MKRRSTYLTWVVVGSLFGGATVGVLAVLYAVGGHVLDRAVRPDDAGLAVFAAFAGATWGAIGGAVAGLLCAAVLQLLSTRGWEGRGTYAAVASCVVAAIAGPFQLQSWRTTSTGEAIRLVVLPVLVAVALASCGGLLVWKIRSRDAATLEN